MGEFEIRGTDEQRRAFFQAMAKAQAAFRAVNKTRTVHVKSDKGSYTFDYAPLDEVFDATMPALNANGFAVFQPLSANGEGVTLRLLITHSDGAELECSSTMARVGRMQEMGSQVTYMRRYMYQSAVGVVAEEDDDGHAGDGNQRQIAPRQAQAPRQESPRKTPPPLPAEAKNGAVRPNSEAKDVEKPASNSAPAPEATKPGTTRTNWSPNVKASEFAWAPTDLEVPEAIANVPSMASAYAHDTTPMLTTEETKLELRAAMMALGYKGPDVMRKVASVFGHGVKVEDVTTEDRAQQLLAAVMRDVENVAGLVLKLPEFRVKAQEMNRK